MKRLIIILLIVINVSCFAQTNLKFEPENIRKQFLSYTPVQKANVPDEAYNYGTFIVGETKKVIKDLSYDLSYIDYFNMMSAFLSLKESKSNVLVAFEKFINSEGSCEFLLAAEYGIKKNSKYDVIRESINKVLSKCKSKTVDNSEFNVSEYCKSEQLDYDLVEKIHTINNNDQKFRKGTSIEKHPEHKKVDRQNQKLIDSLYCQHKKYIGSSLVGEKFKSVMWAVIQHSNLKMMEKYLPIVQKAVEDKELDVVPLKMLIDRIYSQKEKYQIFGSQMGVKMASETIRQGVIEKYNLE